MVYWIPKYQRGYRWTEVQVVQLLDDIWDFILSKRSGFYCLQPVVIRPRSEGEYEVIDGQQRIERCNVAVVIGIDGIRFVMDRRRDITCVKHEIRLP